jgi:hypothetical protein
MNIQIIIDGVDQVISASPEKQYILIPSHQAPAFQRALEEYRDNIFLALGITIEPDTHGYHKIIFDQAEITYLFHIAVRHGRFLEQERI